MSDVDGDEDRPADLWDVLAVLAVAAFCGAWLVAFVRLMLSGG